MLSGQISSCCMVASCCLSTYQPQWQPRGPRRSYPSYQDKFLASANSPEGIGPDVYSEALFVRLIRLNSDSSNEGPQMRRSTFVAVGASYAELCCPPYSTTATIWSHDVRNSPTVPDENGDVDNGGQVLTLDALR